jgi:Asp-tRNA(Asn)/Glu-tRNA(Gln) amidotransferase A subunit family amidase
MAAVPYDNVMTETVAEILAAYRGSALKPEDVVARSFARIRRRDDPAIFIALRDEADVVAEAKALARDGNMALPLYGIPVAVKDNIDVKGLPTTAACPAFGYRPGKDATAVAKLRQAGALILGKTNLDQFATGLVGVRTPYGIARNLFDDKLIAGGSSTGSALAVAAGPVPDGVKLGVPLPGQRLFFGDTMSAKAYDEALARLTSLGAKIAEIDIEPFYAAARLLYDGPWVAERYLVTKALIASSPESLHPVTRQIILAGAHRTAAETFAAFYQLEELRRVAEHTFRTIDALVLPTAPTIYSVEQVLGDPIQLNSRLGTYTNFVNLLDLCGLAVPSSMRPDGAPFGITLLAPAGADAALAAIGRQYHAATNLPLGALTRG